MCSLSPYRHSEGWRPLYTHVCMPPRPARGGVQCAKPRKRYSGRPPARQMDDIYHVLSQQALAISGRRSRGTHFANGGRGGALEDEGRGAGGNAKRIRYMHPTPSASNIYAVCKTHPCWMNA